MAARMVEDTPLHEAVRKGQADRVRALLNQHGSNNIQDFMGDTSLHSAFFNCDEVAEELIRGGSDVNIKNSRGETPLHRAVGSHSVSAYRQVRAARLLLDCGADVNVQDEEGNTPLHIVCKSFMSSTTKTELCALLVGRGADVGMKDGCGKTCLYTAVEENPTCVPVLLLNSSGREVVNTPSQPGSYPLHIAVQWENDEIVKLLLDHGADINCKTSSGKTGLHIATSSTFYNEHTFTLLLERGADVNADDCKLNTPLHVAADRYDTLYWHGQVFRKLLERGASPGPHNIYGMTPLHYAVRSGSRSMVSKLLGHGVNVNCKNLQGITPIGYVTNKGVFKLLIENGADINIQDLDGKTPLHLVTERPRRVPDDLVSSFLDWGASPTIKDNYGKIPPLADSYPDIYGKFVIRKTSVNMVVDEPEELKGSDNKYYRQCCLEEVEKMKKILLGWNTLFDIFAQISNPRFLGNESLAEHINLRSLKDDFPIYSCLIRSTYRRARKRITLFDEARTILQLPLPEELVTYVLSFVDNESLENVIKAGNNLEDQ